MLAAQCGRVVFQAGYFVLLARSLGAHEFGAFASTLALVSLVAPFAALGSADLLIMDVARRPSLFRREFGHALSVIPVVAVPLSVVVVAAGAVLLPNLPA